MGEGTGSILFSVSISLKRRVRAAHGCVARPKATSFKLMSSQHKPKSMAIFKQTKFSSLKMPKCEIFDLFDLNNFLCQEVSIGRGLGG
jgi:hypothetical protein